ncbi:MAG: CinA family protein [Hyphomicrobiaceae bacterium]
METLQADAHAIAESLKARNETIAVAESSAGGLIAAALLCVPGASKYFLAGAVVYTQQARAGLLGISDEDMLGMRSSSEPYAVFLAERVRIRHGADWGLAETGAAGPSGNRYGDAAGHTCVAVAGPVQSVLTLETGLSERTDNMRRFAACALSALNEAISCKIGK